MSKRKYPQDEERAYRPTKLRPVRYDDEYDYDYEDEDEGEYQPRRSKKTSSVFSLTNMVIFTLLALSVYFIYHPEDNFTGINLNEHESTKEVFAKIHEYKRLIEGKAKELWAAYQLNGQEGAGSDSEQGEDYEPTTSEHNEPVNKQA